jgi:ribosomal protein S6--L-glutamate ligase
MVVSFHPLIEADRNLICAGRDPGPGELAAVRGARAVILPQGCRQSLYAMARENCANVFPNYDARFRHPGKSGQIRLFRETGAPHPATEIFPAVKSFFDAHAIDAYRPVPCVFKLDWGGEGETVFPVRSRAELADRLEQARSFEASGQGGFILQELIDSGNRSIRVVVIGERLVSYGRIAGDAGGLHSNLARGGRIEDGIAPSERRAAEDLCRGFCRKTGINLAGFDVIFRTGEGPPQALLLEINYFFGRRGLGGSEAFYRMLQEAVAHWLGGLDK